MLSSSTTQCPQKFRKKNYEVYRDFIVGVSSSWLKFVTAWCIPDWLTNRWGNELLSFQPAFLFFSFKMFSMVESLHILNYCRSKLLLPVDRFNFCTFYTRNCAKRRRPGQISLLNRRALPEPDSIMQQN